MRALDIVKSFQVCVNLLLLVGVGLDLDTLDASLVLRDCCSFSSTPHQRRQFWASSIPPPEICSCLPKDLAKGCAHSFSVSFACRGRQAILPPTFGFMASARIASPCFTRPKFELGLSSRAPQVSAKRVRLSCSLKSLVFSFLRHDVLNVGPSTPHLSSTTRSCMDSSDVVLWLHLSSFGQSSFKRFRD